MTTAEQTAAQAVVLADLIGLAAEQQTSRRLSDRLASLAAALSEHTGALADRLELEFDVTPVLDDATRRVALAMLDPQAGVTVHPTDRDAFMKLLGPMAASCRCSEPPGPIIGQLLSAALNRVAVAASTLEPAPSAEVVMHELQLHEQECPIEPVVRHSNALACPCRQSSLLQCSKCAVVLRVFVARCAHVEDLCVGRLDDWVDAEPTTA